MILVIDLFKCIINTLLYGIHKLISVGTILYTVSAQKRQVAVHEFSLHFQTQS